jgi:hypothetical protein
VSAYLQSGRGSFAAEMFTNYLPKDTVAQLQWGRSFSAVEITVIGTVLQPQVVLQFSCGLATAET